MNKFPTRHLCEFLASLLAFAGFVGMALSLLVLLSGSQHEVVAGGFGFITGAILIGASLISLTMLACTAVRKPTDEAAAG